MNRIPRIPIFYVVTRGGRRTTQVDFWTRDRAEEEAARIRKRLKKWSDPDYTRIEIIKTTHPESIT